MRYLPLTETERRAMLGKIGAAAVDDLYADVPVPARDPDVDLPSGACEMTVERAMAALAARSRPAGAGPFFCGAGAYRHHIPACVDHLMQRSEFLTSYTPYQPEISQGTLQYLFEFQTQVAQLTGMEIANASMYDGSTAAAEATLMALRLTGRKTVLLDGALHPHYAATVETLAGPHGHIIRTKTETQMREGLAADVAAVVVQTPDVFGSLRDLRPLAEAAHEAGALLIAVVTEIVSLGLIEAPGSMGADIVAAEGQSLAGPMSFGGPYIGLLASRAAFVRQMPGRLVGQTVDTHGRRGFVLTLSAREQHIRREKATSNICTNSGLCALAFTIHLTLLGEEGLTRLAMLNHARTCRLAARLEALAGVERLSPTFFNEFSLDLCKPAAPVVDALADKGILAGVPASRLFPPEAGFDNRLIVAATETVTDDDETALVEGLAGALA